MADFQQQREGELGYCIRAVARYIGDRNAFLSGVDIVYYIVTGSQYADIADGRAAVQYPLCDGRFIGNDDFCLSDTRDRLILISQGASVIYNKLSQLLQSAPAQIAWLFSISV